MNILRRRSQFKIVGTDDAPGDQDNDAAEEAAEADEDNGVCALGAEGCGSARGCEHFERAHCCRWERLGAVGVGWYCVQRGVRTPVRAGCACLSAAGDCAPFRA